MYLPKKSKAEELIPIRKQLNFSRTMEHARGSKQLYEFVLLTLSPLSARFFKIENLVIGIHLSNACC